MLLQISWQTLCLCFRGMCLMCKLSTCSWTCALNNVGVEGEGWVKRFFPIILWIPFFSQAWIKAQVFHWHDFKSTWCFHPGRERTLTFGKEILCNCSFTVKSKAGTKCWEHVNVVWPDFGARSDCLPSKFIPAWRHFLKRHAGQFFLRILSMMQSFLPAHR